MTVLSLYESASKLCLYCSCMTVLWVCCIYMTVLLLYERAKAVSVL